MAGAWPLPCARLRRCHLGRPPIAAHTTGPEDTPVHTVEIFLSIWIATLALFWVFSRIGDMVVVVSAYLLKGPVMPSFNVIVTAENLAEDIIHAIENALALAASNFGHSASASVVETPAAAPSTPADAPTDTPAADPTPAS